MAVARTMGRSAPGLGRGLAVAGGAVLVLVAVGVALPLAVPVVVVPVAWLLARTAAGRRPGPRASTGRYVWTAVGTVVAGLLAWLATILLGLFLLGYACTWLWFGLTTVVVLRLWCRLLAHSEPRTA